MGEHLQRPLQLFSREKLDECRDMPLEARLRWLEDANGLVCKVLGKTWLDHTANTKSQIDMALNSPVSSFDNMLTKIKVQMLQSLNPEKIILFGSQATNTATKDSDIDLLLVMNSDLPPRKRNLLIKRLFPHRSFALDAIVYTPQEYQRYKDIPGTLAYQAEHHGRLLYG